jgi:hypothetical protein
VTWRAGQLVSARPCHRPGRSAESLTERHHRRTWPRKASENWSTGPAIGRSISQNPCGAHAPGLVRFRSGRELTFTSTVR